MERIRADTEVPGAVKPGKAESDGLVYVLYSRGYGLLRDGHPHQAVALLSRAKLIEPNKASIREALGRALFLSGRIGRARREFAKAVHLDPVNDYAHFALALACERTGQPGRASAHIKLAVAMRPASRDYQRAMERIAG